MIRYRYIPFTFGKPKFARKDEPADVHKWSENSYQKLIDPLAFVHNPLSPQKTTQVHNFV